MTCPEKIASINRNREALDPEIPQAVFEEFEPFRDSDTGPNAPTDVIAPPIQDPSAASAKVRLIGGITVLLTASRCPLRCTMCDLWQNTLPGPTPPGAIPRQIKQALDSTTQRGWIKLYNAGNFFDTASIPLRDYAAIAELTAPFDRVIVENHPRIGRRHIADFASRIDADLEIAIGVESVRPRFLVQLNKQFTRDQLESFHTELLHQNIDTRAFLMVGGPGWSLDEAIQWARLSVRYVADQGYRHAALIPARPDDGQDAGGWAGLGQQLTTLGPPDLLRLHQVILQDLAKKQSPMIATMDLWGMNADDPIVGALRKQNETQLT